MKKSEKTKERIEEAALTLFYEKGFDGASTAEIAQSAGVAEGTIFRYFPTKKSILTNLLVKFIERFGERIIMDGVRRVFDTYREEPIEVLMKALVLDRYELFKTHSNLAMVIFAEARYHPDIMKTIRTHIVEKVVSYTIAEFKNIPISESIRKDVPFPIMIRSFVGAAMIAIVQRELFFIEGINRPFEEELDMIIDLYFNGVMKR